MKTQVMKETAKHWPNLKMKGMPEHVKRAVARRFQEVSSELALQLRLWEVIDQAGCGRLRLRRLKTRSEWGWSIWKRARGRL